MAKSLELRSLPYIAAGYVLAPLIGLTAMWLFWAVPSMFGPPFQWRQALSVWLLMIIVGGGICLVVELVLVTPILIAFRRYRWLWLNGWSAVAIGFLVDASFALIIGSLPPPSAYGVGAISALVLRVIAVRTASDANPPV